MDVTSPACPMAWQSTTTTGGEHDWPSETKTQAEFGCACMSLAMLEQPLPESSDAPPSHGFSFRFGLFKDPPASQDTYVGAEEVQALDEY